MDLLTSVFKEDTAKVLGGVDRIPATSGVAERLRSAAAAS